MRQLFKNGDVVQIDAEAIAGNTNIPAETPLVDISATQLASDTVMLEFASSADGRGFSLGKLLKRQLSKEHQLIATGALIPDHLELAWQCGFDSAIISEELWQRCGPDNWQ